MLAFHLCVVLVTGVGAALPTTTHPSKHFPPESCCPLLVSTYVLQNGLVLASQLSMFDDDKSSVIMVTNDTRSGVIVGYQTTNTGRLLTVTASGPNSGLDIRKDAAALLLVSNPMSCVIAWRSTQSRVFDSRDREFLTFEDRTRFGVRLSDGVVKSGLVRHSPHASQVVCKIRSDVVKPHERVVAQEGELIEILPNQQHDVLFVDCLESAKEHLKLAKVEYEELSLDFDSISNMKSTKSLSVYDKKEYKNDSPNKMEFTYQYTKTSETTVTVTASAIETTAENSEWIRKFYSSSEWKAEGIYFSHDFVIRKPSTQIYCFVGGFSFYGISGSGGYSHNDGNEETNSGSQTKTETHEKGNSKIITSSTAVADGATIKLKPCTTATVTVMQEDIKGAKIPTIAYIRVEPKAGYSKTQVSAILKRTGIHGLLAIDEERHPDFVYLKLRVDLAVDMQRKSNVDVKGGYITHSTEHCNGSEEGL